MNDNSDKKPSLDLSSLDFGPAWARKGDDKPRKFREPRENRGGKGGDRKGRRPRAEGGNQGERRGGQRRDQRGPRRERPVAVPAPEGLKAEIMPIEEGIDNLAKEITATGRTYSVFELARVVLGARERFHVVFRKEENGPELFQCKKDGSVFLTKEECLTRFEQAEWKEELYKSEEIEVEAPAGNYTAVAKCGFSGELLGPPNFHGYQEKVIELHRSKFSNMDLERYKSRIVTEKGEEAVEAWRESMKKQTQFRPIDDEDTVLANSRELERHFVEKHFDSVFRSTHRADVIANIPGKQLSPALLTLLKETVADQRRYPGQLSSFLCRQLSGRHLAVFKWQGKLHAGPSRPHQLPDVSTLAERLQKILAWVEAHAGEGIDKLWADVLPADISDEGKAEWYHDLHWLLNAGFVVFMNDGHLFPSAAAKAQAKKQSKAANAPEKAKKGEKAEAPKADKVDDASGEAAE